MKTIITILLLSGMAFWQPDTAVDSTATEQPAFEYCELKGQVYIERTAGFADYRVFIEKEASFSEMKVYKEEIASFATEPGIWHITDVRGFADFTIYLEEVQTFADFTISYTDFRSEAGCK